ncbi:hypothetical protein GRAN_3643 [Granulicella sibirica]|uniref:Uncharacterized protein n=1 Tax=Granulicella sibirica TaxID=2479048 RepID=A0A4Q0SX47_9BACT|nr:hypothetical protein GRAN_3643 [Granulicella sibirica]
MFALRSQRRPLGDCAFHYFNVRCCFAGFDRLNVVADRRRTSCDGKDGMR